MLIVNADDLGASQSTTDVVVECFQAGVLTSASAMVWMPESERAAQLARDIALPVGLHLNLTLPFAGEDVPLEARQRQLELTRVFDHDSWREGPSASPGASQIAAAIAEQLEEFRRQFGEPTHLDGHHHIHVQRAVLEQLPRSLPIRPPLTSQAKRSFAQRRLLRRFRGPDVCLPLGCVHPALGGLGLSELEPARRATVEVMVHPALAPEHQALLSGEWRSGLSELSLGSYRDIPTAL